MCVTVLSCGSCLSAPSFRLLAYPFYRAQVSICQLPHLLACLSFLAKLLDHATFVDHLAISLRVSTGIVQLAGLFYALL